MIAPLDANGKPLKVGDAVFIPAVITDIVRDKKNVYLLVQYQTDMEFVVAIQPSHVEKRK